MTIGSAASLTGITPQALSPLPLARPARPTPMAHNLGQGVPPRQLLHLQAEEPPRGRVLVVENEVSSALELQRLLRDLGYLVVGPARSADEAQQMVDRIGRLRRPVDCALLDVQAAGVADLAARLACQGIAFIWVAPAGGIPPSHPEAARLELPCNRHALLGALSRETARKHRAGGDRAACPSRLMYPKPPPQEAWPRIWPQL